ncbi:MAG TPA: hypothetical protein VHC91_14265 [Trinickia sp.]|uniref:cytochrome oxidase putative small subunit CydP n=1 Tax=Trinickia sp. TaxID=2571163 RepID=UPI002CEDA161|nr:cytochrome oxidase putative small subunit CydP [Trinickia sp.]HVW51539.1 hypothetical protein [Trinickia sp.]
MRALHRKTTAHAAPPSGRGHRSFAASLGRWARGPTFARDITLVLALKVVLLIGLKFAFFNHPRASDMSLPPAEVARALLSSPAPRVSQGVGHAQ